MPSSLEGALEAIKKHEDFLTTMEASEEKINCVVESGRRLVSDGNANGDKIQEKADSIEERYGEREKTIVCMLKQRSVFPAACYTLFMVTEEL